jgi:hypothetical protein
MGLLRALFGAPESEFDGLPEGVITVGTCPHGDRVLAYAERGNYMIDWRHEDDDSSCDMDFR